MKVIRCQCYGEGVAVESWDEDVHLAFWQQGHSRSRGLGFRIRHMLKILRDGTPYTDMVVLSPTEAKTLAIALHEAAESVMLKDAEARCGVNRKTEIHDPVSGERKA